MKDSLQMVIEALVEDKDAIEIQEKAVGRGIVFEIKVAKADMGRVIGKEGRIAKAIRTLFKAIGTKENVRISIEFVD